MQQEFTDFKKRDVNEIKALRQENSQLKRKVEADAMLKGKEKVVQEESKTCVSANGRRKWIQPKS